MIAWAVVVAGGSGARFGRLKQFDVLAGRRVIDWSVSAMVPHCRGVVVVGPADRSDEVAPPGGWEIGVEVRVVAGGATRSASVRAGLGALDADVTHVLVHDAARPLVTAEVVSRVCDALVAGAVGVVPVVPVTDSLRTIDGEPVDRSRLVAVQTPQGFELAALRSAHARGVDASDDAGLLHLLGVPVMHVAGDATNLKITEPHDLRVAEVLLHDR